MTISIAAAAWDELWEESWQTSYSPEGESFVEICKTPEAIGEGTFQSIELYPDVWLGIGHRRYREDILIQYPEAEHPIQLGFLLSGLIVNSDSEQISPRTTFISGSGIQRQMSGKSPFKNLEVFVEIQMPPDRLAVFFPNSDGHLPAELEFLVRGDDWQTLIYPKSNPAIRQTLQQIVNCPYRGIAKRLYLQGKMTELMALQFASVLGDRARRSPCRLKSQTVSQIHQAKEILLNNLENPPSVIELAQQIGVSERTLQRGFQELFGESVFGYLTQQRMIEAERLLREGTGTIAEVATQVGYAHLGCFAAAFRRQFGITPRECTAGKVAPRNPG